MKKLLIIIDDLYAGGAQRVVSRLANELVEDHEVVILNFSKKKTYPLDNRIRLLFFKDPAYRPSKIPGKAGVFFTAARRFLGLRRQLISIMLKEHPDVVLSMLEYPNLLNAFSGTKGCRKVMSERNDPRGKGRIYYLKEVLSYLKADQVVFQSHTVMEMFPHAIRRKGVVVPNPVRVDCSANGGSERIVTMGRLHPQKNHMLLLKAFALFAKDHPLHTLHIYGRSYDYDEVGYKQLIEQFCLSDKVFLEGYKENVHFLIANAEQFVLSSDYEGTPNALLEAMMMGLPCISTEFESAKELFGNSDACCLTPIGNEKMLAESMARLADDVAYRRALSVRGKRFAETFSVQNVIPQWHKVLFFFFFQMRK